MHEADVVLCAANGIGTPRLLLASATAGHPDGLANDSGLVGCGLMLHPMTLVQGTLPDAAPSQGHNGGLINSLQFYETDASRGFVRGARWALTGGGQPLALALGHTGEWGPGHHAPDARAGGPPAAMGAARRGPARGPQPRHARRPSSTARGCPASASATAPATTPSGMLAWHAERARESLRRPARSTSGSSGRGPTATSWAPRGWATIPRLRSAIAGDSPIGSAISASSTAASSRRRAG